MSIDKIIFSINDNPKYHGLWEINSQICKEHLGITPILFHITNEDSDFYNDKWGVVKKIKALPGIDNGFQSQIFRMFGTKYFQDEVCLISDIDMLLFDNDYIKSPLEKHGDNDLIIYCSDAYDTNREECIGIYGENRYPICYNLGTGEVFNKILNTNRSFEEYCLDIINLGFPLHDSDELYFGNKVNNFNHGVNIVKLKRGYSTHFKCPNRIDRVNDDIFNEYDVELLKNGEYIDCHLSRPYIKYKKEIDNMRDIILGHQKKEVYLIGCHIDNFKQKSLLYELIDFLTKNNKNFVLTSHTNIPSDIVEKSVGFIYDSNNPKYKTWDIIGFPKFVFETENFNIESPYITYGSSEYYHVGVIRLIINGIKYLKTLDYEIVHWIEYDSIPVIDMDNNANKLLNENDFIFYGIGARFSFNLSKVNEDFINMNDDVIFKNLSENNFLAERLIGNKLINGVKKTIFLDEKDKFLWGRYSQNFNNQKINFSLFESGENVNLFITNISNEIINVLIEHKNENINLEINPNIWIWRNLCLVNDIGDFKISIIEDDNKTIIINENLSDVKKYESIVKSVNFIEKK